MTAQSRAALGLVVAGLFMALAGWPTTALGSAAPTPASTQTPAVRPTSSTAAQPAVDIEIVAITPQVLDVTSEEHVTVVATITNDSTTTITAGQVTLSLAARNMRSRNEVASWAAGTLDLKLQVLARADLPASFEPGASADVTLTVDRTAREMEDNRTLANEWGPRGLVVEVDEGSTTGEARTFLLVKSTQQIDPAPVALLAALTGPPVAPTLPEIGASTVPTPDETTRQRLEKVAGAVASSPQVGLAVDPALVTGDDAGVLAEVLDSGRWEVLTLPWGDPDLQALAQAQTSDLLTQARQLAADEPDQSVVWSVDPVDDQTVAAVRATGAGWMVAPSSATRTLTGASTPDGDLTVLSPDETVSALFDGSSGLSQAQAQQQALALLATAARGTDKTSEPEPVLVVTSRDWEADAAWTESFVAALAGAPWVRLTTTTDLIAGAADLPVAVTEAAPTPDAGLAALDADRRDLAKFATVTERPALITGGVDQATLLVSSYAWRTDPDGQPGAVTALRDAIAERRNALYLTKRTDLTLITKKGDVRFNVRNDLPVAATVRVRLEPTKPCLSGDSRSTLSDDSAEASTIRSSVVTAPPNSDTPVAVTLYAQANCQVTVLAELVGTDGAVVTTEPVEFETTVRAQLEVLGTTVVGVLLGIGLLLGVVRTVRRGQSARRGDRTTADPVRLGVLGGETPIAGIPIAKRLTPIGGIPAVKKPPDPPDPPDKTT